MNRVESVELGERTLSLRSMPFKEARKHVNRLLRITGNGAMLQGEGADELSALGLSTFMVAAMAGRLSDDDIDCLCALFGQYTDIVTPGTTSQVKFGEAQQAAVFGSDLELMYRWFDLCTDFHFGDTLKKFGSGHSQMSKRIEEKVREKTLSTPDDQS